MKKRKLKAKVRALKREVRELKAAIAAQDPLSDWFTSPFKMGDTVRVKLPERFIAPQISIREPGPFTPTPIPDTPVTVSVTTRPA